MWLLRWKGLTARNSGIGLQIRARRGQRKGMGVRTLNGHYEKHSVYQIETDGFEKTLLGMFHMVQTVPLGRKCRIVLEYDPVLQKTTIETFIDKSNAGQAQEETLQWVSYEPTR